jgi:hypothetical protein
VDSTPVKTATGCDKSTAEPLRSVIVRGSFIVVSSAVSRLSTSNGPSVSVISPPGLVAGTGALLRILQVGRTVTRVFSRVATTVMYERSITPNSGIGCPAGQPITRCERPSELVGNSSEASLEYALAKTLYWYTRIGAVERMRNALEERHVPGAA